MQRHIALRWHELAVLLLQEACSTTCASCNMAPACNPFLCYLQGKQVAQSSFQTAGCSEQPSSLCTPPAHVATPPSASAPHASRVPPAPSAHAAGCRLHSTAKSGTNAMLPVIQPGSDVITQEHPLGLVSVAESHWSSEGSNAHAASGATYPAGCPSDAKAVNRLSEGAATATSDDSAEDSNTHELTALLLSDVHPPGMITDAWGKPQHIFRSSQLLPSGKERFVAQLSPRGPSPQGLSTSMLTHTEASARSRSLAEPSASAAPSAKSPSTEASATSLSGTGRPVRSIKDPLLSQLSSIFGSPKASVAEQLDHALVGADSDSTATSPGSAHSQSCQLLPHQPGTAAWPFEACTAACTDTCLLALPKNLLESTHEVDTACVDGPGPRALTTRLAAGGLEHGFVACRASVVTPLCTSLPAVAASTAADHGVAGSLQFNPPVLVPEAEIALPVPLASDAMDATSNQDARADVNWAASRALAAQQRHSSSCG